MADLARHVTLSHTAVRKWAIGASVASGMRLKRLCAVTGRPEYWFFMEPDVAEGKLEDVATERRELDEKEEVLLSLFGQLSEKEKLHVIIHVSSIVHNPLPKN